ncbi:MAG: hypothetical protein QN178_12815 [Armatimonadota bacterium]|nr:hypothetical protein [Armatimonadota bacterium]
MFGGDIAMVSRRIVVSVAAALVFATALWVPEFSVQSAPFTVSIATATIAGRPGVILVEANGFALYYLTSDRGTVSACGGACAGTWPPLLSGAPPTGPSLPGRLTVVSTAHGSQVSYGGHLLYRYAGDAQPGQINGHDRAGPGGGRWYVATPRMSDAASGAPGSGGGNDGGGGQGSGGGY